MNSTESAREHTPGRPRQIILGCDGTNNTLTGEEHDTNVLKLIGQLAPGTGEQILYYDPGVGSHDQLPTVDALNDVRRKLERLAGLANGRGIYENIAEAYLFLVDHYRAGDQIYIFGFSRGAFTARSVAGMVNLFGIIRSDSKSLILTLIRLYFSAPSDSQADVGLFQRYIVRATCEARNKEKKATDMPQWAPDTSAEQIEHYLASTTSRRSTREEVAAQVRRSFTSVDGAAALVHFIGVWDTVESVGIPGLKRVIPSTATTSDKPYLRHIRHALSMDEHRFTFAPRVYWEDDYDHQRDDPGAHRSLRQRWFRGVHSDIGGGYDTDESGLSDQAYRWMLDEAATCGLHVASPPPASTQQSKPFIVHDACHKTPWWGVAGLTVRCNVPRRIGGVDQPVQVKTAGVASVANPRLYSVWNTARTTYWKILAALVCIFTLFAWYGWTAFAAFSGGVPAEPVTRIVQGAAALEAWKLTYVPDAFSHGMPLGRALLAVTPAVQATIIDFGLIVAYSWLLGLCATWAFQVLSAHRHPSDPVSWRFSLGLAPLVLVLADVAENVLCLITMWCMAHHLQILSYCVGAVLAIVTRLKWVAAVGAVALIAWGVVAKAWTSARRTERRRAGPRHKPVFPH